MKIKYRRLTNSEGNQMYPLSIIDKGDWVDLYTNEKTTLMNGQDAYIPLGVAMQLPEGFEAIVAPRSSLYKKFGIIAQNSIGIIDNSYCSDSDQWHFLAVVMRDTFIPGGTRICQFRIQLSQKATFWQKLKWLFSNRIELVEVDYLGNVPRGGLGSTGN